MDVLSPGVVLPVSSALPDFLTSDPSSPRRLPCALPALLPVLLLGLVAPGASRLSAAPSPELLVPKQAPGTKAQVAIVTPVDLTVIDPEKTEAMRRLEQRRTPLIFSANTNAIRLSQEQLDRAFASMREKFRNRLQTNFQRQVLLSRQLNIPKFDRFIANFQRAHKNFPLTTNLAVAWATGQSGQEQLDEWSRVLAGHAPAWILPSPLPGDFKSSSPTAKIHIPSPDIPSARLQSVLSHARTIAVTNLVSLVKARRIFEQALPQDSPRRNRYLASFLQPSLAPMENLTRQWQTRRTKDLWAADSYRSGGVLVAAGEIITPKIQRALDQMNAALEKDRLQSDLQQEQSKNQSALAWMKEQTEAAYQERHALRTQTHWMIAGTALFLLALFAIGTIWRRNAPASRSLALAPVSEITPPTATVDCPACQTPVTVPVQRDPASQAWQDRALQAEQRAHSAVALLRSRHAPGLFRWIKSRFVQNMVAQHKNLVSDQEKAEEELQSLIERLSAVQAPVAERLRAYEARIEALEKELQDKDKENRALIEAKLEATRQQIRREEIIRKESLSLA